MAKRGVFRAIPSSNKYKNRKIETPDGLFDSKKEYRRWIQLKILEDTGTIYALQRQVKFTLIPAQREPDTVGARGGIHKGKTIEKECAYIADFVYTTADGLEVVEDTKGFRTADYIIKRKLMLERYGIRIKEV